MEHPAYKAQKAEIMRIRAKSKLHKGIADEGGIDSLVLFFDRYGTENDIFTAHYYKSEFLLDIGENDSAFASYVKTHALWPSQPTEMDSDMMRCLYYTVINICNNDLNMSLAKEWLLKAETSGVFDANTVYILYHSKAWVFYAQNMQDSCRSYMQKSWDFLKEQDSWDNNMSWCLNEQAAYFALAGMHEEFIKRYELLQKHPYNGVNSATDLQIGMYHSQNGNADSAEWYYRKAMNGPVEIALLANAQLAMNAKKMVRSIRFLYASKEQLNCMTLFASNKGYHILGVLKQLIAINNSQRN